MHHKYKHHYIRIEPDPDPLNPRSWDKLGTLVTYHPRHLIGEEQFEKRRLQAYGSWLDCFKDYLNAKFYLLEPQFPTRLCRLSATDKKEVQAWLAENVYFACVYIYEHSGIRLNTDKFSQLPQGHARFDTGRLGFIYCNKNQLKRYCYPRWYRKSDAAARHEKAIQILQDEIELLNQYLSGQVWHYTILDKDDEVVDSCGNFYDREFALDQAKSVIDYHYKEKLKSHQKQVKAWIKNEVPLAYRHAFSL